MTLNDLKKRLSVTQSLDETVSLKLLR